MDYRHPCLSPSPETYNAIQLSHPLMPSYSSAFNLSQHQGLFQWVSCWHQMTKILELQLQHPSFQWVFRVDQFDLLAVRGTFRSLLQYHSLKASVLELSAFFMVQLSQLYVNTRKTIVLTIWTFVSRVVSLLFNTLSRCVIAFLPSSIVFWFHGCSHHLQWFWSPRKGNLSLFPHLPIYLPCRNGAGCHALSLFLLFSLKLALSLSSFTFIKRLFISSLLSAIRVVSSAYLRLLIFLPPWFQLVTHPAWHFSWCAQHIA